MTKLRLQLIPLKYNRLTEKGFTLVELIIIIVILTILSLVGLPQVMSQANKARLAEAKSNLGAINRAQQAYRLERGVFATSIQALNVDFSVGHFVGDAYETHFYHYVIQENPNSEQVYHAAVPRPVNNYDNRKIISAVFLTNFIFDSVICEAYHADVEPVIINSQQCENGNIIK